VRTQTCPLFDERFDDNWPGSLLFIDAIRGLAALSMSNAAPVSGAKGCGQKSVRFSEWHCARHNSGPCPRRRADRSRFLRPNPEHLTCPRESWEMARSAIAVRSRWNRGCDSTARTRRFASIRTPTSSSRARSTCTTRAMAAAGSSPPSTTCPAEPWSSASAAMRSPQPRRSTRAPTSSVIAASGSGTRRSDRPADTMRGCSKPSRWGPSTVRPRPAGPGSFARPPRTPSPVRRRRQARPQAAAPSGWVPPRAPWYG